MYFVTYTKYIVFRTVSIHQFLGCCIVSCNPKIDYLVTDQETNTMDNFESVYSLSINQLTKATEDSSKEDCQAASVFPIPDHVICSIPTKNPITLDRSILNNWLVCGYSGYQNLMGTVDTITVGEYIKTMNHNGRIIPLLRLSPSRFHLLKIYFLTVHSFTNVPRPFQPYFHSKPQ